MTIINKLKSGRTMSVWISLPSVAFILLSNCAQEAGVDSLGSAKKTNQRPAGSDEASAVFDFAKECGLSKEKMDDKSAVLVEGSYTSFPIVVQGTSMGADFIVITQAKLRISATADQTSQQVQVELKDSAANGSGFVGLFAPGVTKSKAQAAAAANSGSTTSTSLPKKEWLKLTNGSNPEFKDLLCVATGTKTMNINKGGTKAAITFTPALISSINPLAPIERMKKEIGSGKSFAITANVQGSGSDLAKGSVQGRVTVHEVTPSFTQQDVVIKADIAYEFIFEFPGGAYKVGLPKRQVFYIDTAKKQIRAIINEDDKLDETTQKVLPPVYLVRDP